MTEKKSRGHVGSFIDRNATILTILAMAALVLIPSKIAYDASRDATNAGNKAQHAADKSRIAVVRLENERRARIYDQNGIDRYFCGKSVSIEKVLSLLLTASLGAHHPDELTLAQLRARAVFESVLNELSSAPKCEVLIPAPPKPKPGESSQKGEAAESQAQEHPEGTKQLSESPQTGAVDKPPGSLSHVKPKPTPSKPQPHKSPPSSQSPPEKTSQGDQEAAAPTPTSTDTTTEPPAESTPTEATSPARTNGLIPNTVESVEGVVGCLGQLSLDCTLGEVVGKP